MNTTLVMFFAGIGGLMNVSSMDAWDGSSDAALAGAAVGTTLGLGFVFMLWLLFSGAFLIVGLMMKKSAKEVGPTGPLASRT